MTDYTAEVEARLRVDAEEMVKEFRSAGSKRQSSDIRAALGEIERWRAVAQEALSLLAGDGKDVGALRNLRAEAAEQRVRELERGIDREGLVVTLEAHEAEMARAEAAEAKLAEAQEQLALIPWDRWTLAEAEVERLRVDADHEQGLRWLAQMSASEAYAKRDCLLSDLSVMKARAERAEAALAAEEEKREQAEGQCETVSRECIRSQADVRMLQDAGEINAAHAVECQARAERAEAEVERLTNKLNADSQNFEIECLRSEVERLKHLIFVWRQASYSGTPDEYQRAAVDLEDEALRIGVVRAGPKHSKHPTGDYCVYCRSQWPCEESGGE